ncbi:hypothetical protein GXW78_00380 [Roseomonas terrae]|jgi:hypothetical protein|uniref:Terminase small subunit n=1 Tax=Neoroseomonas terrae TaxID=424799 RepID=A0ABS5EBP0_9PROT|nr:hypothetical protein [Neoroseomonas terrae]MBR0648102.1 hypothetical protein [Neoroseomonas terrae]
MTAPDAQGWREKQAATIMKQHREALGYDPTALRCAYGDAANLIDAIRKDLEPRKPLRGESGRRAEAVAAALKHAADAVWAMRESVSTLPPPPREGGG